MGMIGFISNATKSENVDLEQLQDEINYLTELEKAQATAEK